MYMCKFQSGQSSTCFSFHSLARFKQMVFISYTRCYSWRGLTESMWKVFSTMFNKALHLPDIPPHSNFPRPHVLSPSLHCKFPSSLKCLSFCLSGAKITKGDAEDAWLLWAKIWAACRSQRMPKGVDIFAAAIQPRIFNDFDFCN